MTNKTSAAKESQELYERYCTALLSRGICPPLHKDGSRKKRSEVTGEEMMKMATAAHQDVLRMQQDRLVEIRQMYPVTPRPRLFGIL